MLETLPASRTGSLVHQGYRITLHTLAAPEAPQGTLVFLHGLEGRWDDMAALFPRLARTHQIHSLEMPWSGNQGHHWGLKENPAGWVKKGLSMLEPGPFTLIAHSFGATMALEYLCTVGDARVERLVLASPFYKRDLKDVDWNLMMTYTDAFPRLLQEGFARKAGGRLMKPEVLEAMSGIVRDRVGIYGWLEFFGVLSRTPVLDTAGMEIPCLVLHGEKDFTTSLADCRDLAASVPGARLAIIPGAGHFSFVDNPEAVLSHILHFLPPP